jgi:hypothetical protein
MMKDRLLVPYFERQLVQIVLAHSINIATVRTHQPADQLLHNSPVFLPIESPLYD